MIDFNETKKLILTAIRDFDLNLENACVLTEAASGPFIVTPLIAALAGARVYAVTRDSQYGKATDVIRATKTMAEAWGVSGQIEFGLGATPQLVSRADIVTNLGFVRPLHSEMIALMKQTAVIPLMFETWEFRKEDIDLEACARNGIKVMGTNEQDKRIEMFDYVGLLVRQLLIDHGHEIKDRKIVLIGSGIFVDKAEAVLVQEGARVERIEVDRRGLAKKHLSEDVDVIVVLEHNAKTQLIGEYGMIKNEKSFWKDRSVLHVCGEIDAEWLVESGAHVSPKKPAPFGHMSFSTAYLGVLPVIRLHTAGLKVGEAMWRGRRNGLEGAELKRFVQETSPAMAFKE